MSLLLALTGGSAGAYTLTADAGSYSLSGQSSNVLRSKRLVAVSGAYALTGVAAGILHSYKLTAVSGTYTLTGVAAIISYTPIAGAYVLTANTGVYTLNGSAAAVLHSHRLTSATGAYALSGLPANVYRNKKLASNAGSYSYSGNAANIVYTPIASGYTLTANSGSYVLSGKDASIVRAGGQIVGGGFIPDETKRSKPRKLRHYDDVEPDIVELIEKKAEISIQPKKRIASESQMRSYMVSAGIPYQSTHRQIYLELVQEMRQQAQDDDEAIATLIAMMI